MSTATKSNKAAISPTAAAPSPDLDDDLPVRATAYPMQKVEWLWPGRIPIGKVTLLVGDPGLGKSLLAIDATARVTTAQPWPDELPTTLLAPSATTDLHQQPPSAACGLAEPPESSPAGSRHSPLGSRLPGSVLILSAEDKIADTIRPRLAAHGADEDRVYFAPSVADLRHDLAKLERMLDHIPDCRLIVVDPVNAYVGSSDSHFHTIIRKVLAPFAELADRKGIAILAVTHLRKNVGAALHRATGSMAFVASARTVWCVARDPENPDRNLLLPIKNNLRALGTGLAYSIAADDALDAAAVHWHPGDVAATAEEVFASLAKKRGPDSIECRAAAEWLAVELSSSSQPANHMIREGKRLGFNPRTLRRALYAAGGSTKNGGGYNTWMWSLPAKPTRRTPSPKTIPDHPAARGLASSPTNVASANFPNSQSEFRNPQSPAPTHAHVVKETCPLLKNPEISPPPPPPSPPPLASSATTNLHQPTSPQPKAPPSAATPHSTACGLAPPTPPTNPPSPNPQSPRAAHPLNGHPVISQILWPLRTPPPQLKTQPPPRSNDS